jgi:hypothetical protein
MLEWLKKKKPPPSPLEAEDRPADRVGARQNIEEAATLEKLNRACWLASLSAEKVGEDKLIRPVGEFDGFEHKRYRKLRNEAISIADLLSDDFYRSAALELLIELFIKAGEFDDAQNLFNNITVEMFKKRVAEKYPLLAIRKQ